MKGLVVFILMSWSSLLFSQGIELSLDTNEILIGQQTDLIINASSGKPIQWFEYPNKDGRYEDLIDGIEILKVGDIDTLFEGKFPNYVQRVTITAFDSGYFVIPPLKMAQKDADSLVSNPLLLTVKYPEMSEESDFQLSDLKEQEDLPFIVKELVQYWWVLFSVLGLLIGLYLFSKYRESLKNKPVEEPKKPTVPAHVTALKLLEELEKKKLWQKGDFKTYYSEISYILRSYLGSRFGVDVLEYTTYEISVRLSSNLDKENLQKVTWILEETDMAKYAKSTPIESENVRVLEETRKVVEETKKEVIEE